jgi:hypothetical protein
MRLLTTSLVLFPIHYIRSVSRTLVFILIIKRVKEDGDLRDCMNFVEFNKKFYFASCIVLFGSFLQMCLF